MNYKLFHSYGNRAILHGVLRPLISEKMFTTIYKKQQLLPEMLQSIRRKRNRIYVELAELQCPPFTDPVYFAYRKNCPVCCGRNLDLNWVCKPCKHVLICPFCYGRLRVLDVYKRIACVTHPERDPDENPPYWVLTFNYREQVQNQEGVLQSLLNQLECYKGRRAAHKTELRFLPSQSIVGSCVQNSFVSTSETVTYSRRGVVISRDTRWPDCFDSRYSAASYFKIKRSTLARVVGETFSFPPERLDRSNVEAIRDDLNILRGVRTMFCTGGLLNGRKEG